MSNTDDLYRLVRLTCPSVRVVRIVFHYSVGLFHVTKMKMSACNTRYNNGMFFREDAMSGNRRRYKSGGMGEKGKVRLIGKKAVWLDWDSIEIRNGSRDRNIAIVVEEGSVSGVQLPRERQKTSSESEHTVEGLHDAPMMINNGNRTEWDSIRFVIIRVITKSDDREARVWFVNHEYDYRPTSSETKFPY